MARTHLTLLLVASLLTNAFSRPESLRFKRHTDGRRRHAVVYSASEAEHGSHLAVNIENRRTRETDGTPPSPEVIKDIFGAPSSDNDKKETTEASNLEGKPEALSFPEPYDDDDDDDDDFDDSIPSATTGGSSIFSLLRLVTALFPGSTGANFLFGNPLGDFITPNQGLFNRRQDFNNEIDFDYTVDLKPPLQRQETDEDQDSDNSESDSQDDSNDSEEPDNNNAAEESDDKETVENDSKQDSDSNASDASVDDYDSDEPPEGDGQGGGILGLLAGLSGSEDGQSDLGSLLATVSGIVANLSGDGIDLNAIIASGLGLFVGLLSEGEENPGAVIAGYLRTSLDSISGGGAKNNGAFLGTFLSKLLKGVSAGGDPDASSEEDGMAMTDSGGFFLSFLMGLLGEMSKGSFGGSSHPWRKEGAEHS